MKPWGEVFHAAASLGMATPVVIVFSHGREMFGLPELDLKATDLYTVSTSDNSSYRK